MFINTPRNNMACHEQCRQGQASDAGSLIVGAHHRGAEELLSDSGFCFNYTILSMMASWFSLLMY